MMENRGINCPVPTIERCFEMDEESLQAWLDMGEKLMSEQLHMQLIGDEMVDFLLERGVECEAGSREATLYGITTATLAAIYCMASMAPNHDLQFVRAEADKAVAELGELYTPQWDELLEHYFGGEKTYARYSDLERLRVRKRYEENVKKVLSLMFQMGYYEHLNPDEIQMVLEFVKVMELAHKGLDIATIQEELRLKVLESDLDHEFWTEMVDLIFM